MTSNIKVTVFSFVARRTRSASQASKDSLILSPRRKVLQKAVDTSLKELPSGPRTRSKSVDTPEIFTENTETAAISPKKISLRKRSASVDLMPQILSPAGKNDAIASTSKATGTTKTRKRRVSVTSLPVIQEETKQGEKMQTVDEEQPMKQRKRTVRSKSSSQTDPIQRYSVSRRLTRRQRNMLEKTLGNVEVASQPMELLESESEESEDEERGPRLRHIDPLKLLDKSPFKGKNVIVKCGIFICHFNVPQSAF